MIKTKAELNEWIKYETSKYDSSRVKYYLQIGESAVLIRHVKLLRKAEYYTNTGKTIRSMWYKMRLSKFQNRYCLHIPINTCGKGLKIMHVGPVLLNGNTVIGEDCSIHINTAIVAKGKNNKAPHIGNGVVIGVGASIVGEVYIADYIAIGAGAVVTKSFEEANIAIAGVPARKVSNNGRLSWKNNSEEESLL